jgi:hypothetical protein
MYAKLNNGQVERYPYTIGQLRKDHHNVSFPKAMTDDVLAQFSMARVTPTERPAEDHTKNFTVTVVQSGGKWVEKWTSTSATQAEITERTSNKAAQVRAERDALLASTDYTQLADAPGDATAWASYRDALRNLPTRSGFPWTMTWPTKPE